MTDEELANEYVKDDSKYLIEDVEGNLINITKKVREAFLAGLKAGRPKWHKVADGDLPPANTTVFNEACDKVMYTGYNKWETYSEYYERYIEIEPPIAWHEKPEYIKE